VGIPVHPRYSKHADNAAGAAGLLKMSVTAFVAYLGVQWWASWYPGAEQGGGGYVAQRMMSAKMKNIHFSQLCGST
jgi:hypothetical protein